MTKYREYVERLRNAVLTAAAHTSLDVRRALVDQRDDDVPAELLGYASKVARHAWKVTDSDIVELKRAGYSEDQIFEITVCAATGAGLSRLERGLALLRESR